MKDNHLYLLVQRQFNALFIQAYGLLSIISIPAKKEGALASQEPETRHYKLENSDLLCKNLEDH